MSCPYEPEQVLFESGTPGTYSLNIECTGKYEIWICGGGIGGGSSGGLKPIRYKGQTGSAFQGIVKLNKGIITLIVGSAGLGGTQFGTKGGDSSIEDFIICQGGNGLTEGGGGTNIINIDPVSYTIMSNGLDSSEVSLLGNGYGKGGYSSLRQPTCGYIKIVYKK